METTARIILVRIPSKGADVSVASGSYSIYLRGSIPSKRLRVEKPLLAVSLARCGSLKN